MPNVLENESLESNTIKLLQLNCVRFSPYIAADPILLNATAITLVIIGPSIGALLINISLIVGEFAKTGWLVYPPPKRTQVLARRWR